MHIFADILRVAKRIGLVLGTFLLLIALLDVARFFIALHQTQPILAYLFALAVAGLAGWGGWYVYAGLLAYPKVLKAPPVPVDLNTAGFHELRRFNKYLIRLYDRLATHPDLDDARKIKALQQAEFIDELLRKAHPLKDDLRKVITDSRETVLPEILAPLEARARKEVRASVRDIMLGVTLSPWRGLDAVMVFYRNAAMVVRVVKIFNARPAGVEQLLILKDVLKALITLNFLYVGRNLLENLFSHVPVVGRVVEDIGQGLGVGLFTSAAGHAAIQRCSGAREWNQATAVQTLASEAKNFLKDVRDIFTKDVLPAIKGRFGLEQNLPGANESGFWEKVSGGIQSSVDLTLGVIDQLIFKPVAFAGSAISQTVNKAGSALGLSDKSETRSPPAG